mmetsp:Transcript_105932/g.147712  ORF Transcript_105932/g.147712 Transcript_105932/m.147712 type:complete len:131 (-) Transcript_105932:71-463(-)
MNDITILPTKHQHSHGHFVDYIEFSKDLPKQENFPFPSKDFKAQLLAGLSHKRGLQPNFKCLRDCFLISEPNNYEFCIKRKCHIKEFLHAADQMGHFNLQTDAPELPDFDALEKEVAEDKVNYKAFGRGH